MDTKICSKCKVEKALTEYHRLSKGKNGLHPRCKPCRAIDLHEWYDKNREKASIRHSKRNKEKLRFEQYGISREIYLDGIASREGKCDICGKYEGESLCIDHNHSTGQVRGLLCRKCNWGIGQLQDSPDVVRNALKYLEDWGSSNPLSC